MYVCHFHYDVCGVCGDDRQVGHGVRGGPVEGKREEGKQTTIIHHELIMQQSIVQIVMIQQFPFPLFLIDVALITS